MYAKEEQARLAAHSHQRTRCQSRRRQLQVQSNGSKKQHMGRVCNLLSGSRAMGLSSSAHPQQGQLAMGEWEGRALLHSMRPRYRCRGAV